MASINFLSGQDALGPGKGDSGAVEESHGKGAHGALKPYRISGAPVGKDVPVLEGQKPEQDPGETRAIRGKEILITLPPEGTT